MPAVEPCYFHTRDVGQPVTDINHIAKRNATVSFFHRIVQVFVVRHVENALVYAVQKLDFTCIIQRDRRPVRHAVFVVNELACENFTEILCDFRALDDFFRPLLMM